jgi:cytidylate kinase
MDDLSIYELVINTEEIDAQNVVAQILAHIEKS